MVVCSCARGSGWRGWKRKRINLGPWVTVGDFIKQEEVKEVEDTQKDKDVFSGDEISSIKDDEDERAVPSEYVQLSRPSLTKVSLLNKPPRLGLSKLYRSSTSLHDVSIMEAEDSKVRYQQKGFIIQKEE